MKLSPMKHLPFKMTPTNTVRAVQTITFLYLATMYTHKQAHKNFVKSTPGKLCMLGLVLGVTYVDAIAGCIAAVCFMYSVTRITEGFKEGNKVEEGDEEEDDEEADDEEAGEEETDSVLPTGM